MRVPLHANPSSYAMKYNDCIKYSKYVDDYFTFFNNSLFWMFIYSLTFHLCQFIFNNCGRIHSTFPPSTFVEEYMIFFHIFIYGSIFILLLFAEELYIVFNLSYYGRIHNTFPHFTFVEVYLSSTFNICRRLC